MPTNDTVQARVDTQLKRQADAIFAAIGLKTSDAIRMFLQQAVNVGGLPFQPRVKQPNAVTLEAMEELERGGGERFESVEDMFRSWKKD